MYRNRSHSLCAAAPGLFALLLGAHTAGAITPASAQIKGPLASSFPGPLWRLVAPVGGIASVADGHLLLAVPGGSNHDSLHSANAAVRVMQPIGDVDFDVAIKIDSPMVATDASTSQGLMVVDDDQDFATFALTTDGTSISLSAHTISGGVAQTAFEESNFREFQIPLYLRLARSGTVYTAYYSVDGAVWVQAGSFMSSKVPTWIGPFAGNYNATPSRAVPFVMAINWFNVL